MMGDRFAGRKLITTDLKIVGDINKDANTIKKIFETALAAHNQNVLEEKRLFSIYFNNSDSWTKIKTQRGDINNKITVDDAWAISRTINGYCFGEPIKYVARDTDERKGLQEKVEILSEHLDYRHNHKATITATLCASVCGLGYKLALPVDEDEYEFSNIPFNINPSVIVPMDAFCVYSSDVMHDKVLGVLIGSDNINTSYTVWTKYHRFTVTRNAKGGFDFSAQINPIKRIPLIEIERNPFRMGDWEFATDLLAAKNIVVSGRLDDIQQILDYVLVLYNCKFENEDDKNNALKNRLFELEQKNPNSKPLVEILKNPLDQSGIQLLCDYLDNVIETVVGIPTRAERSGGGHDTGQAVLYRNGFRDLENNAGMIVPEMDKAETEFLGICISYYKNAPKNQLKGLKPFDVRNKFMRSMSDDPITASTSYAAFRNAGMNDLDALIASRAVTDPAEVHKNNQNALTSQNNDVNVKIDDENATSINEPQSPIAQN